jgi:hypothetical protein
LAVSSKLIVLIPLTSILSLGGGEEGKAALSLHVGREKKARVNEVGPTKALSKPEVCASLWGLLYECQEAEPMDKMYL